MMRRSPLKRLSEKKLAAHGGRVPRSTLSAQPVKRRKRKPSEWKRIYGSRQRVEWVKAQPCAWCRFATPELPPRRPSENAHVETGGMGRKADYTSIVPLCAVHHRAYDQHRKPFDDSDGEVRRLLVKIMADKTQERWVAWAANQGADRT